MCKCVRNVRLIFKERIKSREGGSSTYWLWCEVAIFTALGGVKSLNCECGNGYVMTGKLETGDQKRKVPPFFLLLFIDHCCHCGYYPRPLWLHVSRPSTELPITLLLSFAGAINITDGNTGFPVASVLILCYLWFIFCSIHLPLVYGIWYQTSTCVTLLTAHVCSYQ